MDTIYVTGHRNPDTDSIVSAMAYAALRNSLGDREYTAACLGRLSDETQAVLERFDSKPPQLLENVRTQVCDLAYDTPPTLNESVSVDAGMYLHDTFSVSVTSPNWSKFTPRSTACASCADLATAS